VYEEKPMIRYKFIDTVGQFKCENYDGPKINTGNAEWFLFQIGRDIQNSKNIIDIGLRFDNGEKSYDYDDRDIHSVIMKTYIHFISDWEKDIKIDRARLTKALYEKNKLLENNVKKKTRYKIELEIKNLDSQLKNINERIEGFVKTIIDTRIIIENNTVYLFTNNKLLIPEIEQLVLKSKFTFKKIDLEKAKSWWV